MFVEQYYYRDHAKEVSLPLIKYRNDSSQYNGLRGSLDVIWKQALPDRIEVGTAIPVDRARIKNIFREDKRAELTNRPLESIRNTETGTIDIIGNFWNPLCEPIAS